MLPYAIDVLLALTLCMHPRPITQDVAALVQRTFDVKICLRYASVAYLKKYCGPLSARLQGVSQATAPADAALHPPHRASSAATLVRRANRITCFAMGQTWSISSAQSLLDTCDSVPHSWSRSSETGEYAMNHRQHKKRSCAASCPSGPLHLAVEGRAQQRHHGSGQLVSPRLATRQTLWAGLPRGHHRGLQLQ